MDNGKKEFATNDYENTCTYERREYAVSHTKAVKRNMNKRFRKRGKLELKQYDASTRYFDGCFDNYYDDPPYDDTWDWYDDYCEMELINLFEKQENFYFD